MTDFLAQLAESAEFYPQKYDADRDVVLFVRMSRDAYRSASFLDDRAFAVGIESYSAHFSDIERALPATVQRQPVQFIFHTGHVGSTLLSRLLDETGFVLGLREPLPLRTLAELHDRVAWPTMKVTPQQFTSRLETFLTLWRRGFADTTVSVLKATSSSARIAVILLGASPDSKAVYLNLKAETYLATLLAGANAMIDLRGFGTERSHRLANRFGLPFRSVNSLSVGELAAMSWAVESLTQMETKAMFDERVMMIDFDALLGNLEATLGAVLNHFGIGMPQGFLDTIGRSGVLTRYSKAPEEYSYSPFLRAQLLAQARREHSLELSKGLRYLEQLAKHDNRIARIL